MPAGTTTRPFERPTRKSSESRSRIPTGVGRTLRQARIEAGVQLHDVAVQAGAKAKYIRALEWERFDLLPSSEFARRTARAMAQVLHLDVASIDAELEGTLQTIPRHVAGEFPDAGATIAATTAPDGADQAEPAADDAPTSRPTAARPTSTETAALAAGGTALAQTTPAPTRAHWSSEDDEEPDAPSSDTRIGRSRRLLGGALILGVALFLVVDVVILGDDDPNEALVAAESAQPTEPGRVNAGTDPVSARGSLAEPSAPRLAAPASSASASRPTPTDGVPDGNQTGEALSPLEPAADAQPAAKATSGKGSRRGFARGVQHVEVTAARGTSWLQVRRGSNVGVVLYEGLLQSGDVLEFDERTLFMRIGAASAIDITQDGKIVSKKLEGTIDLSLARATGVRVVS